MGQAMATTERGEGAYHNIMAELYATDIPGFTNFMRMAPEFFEMIKTRLSYSSGCFFTNSTMAFSWLSVNVAQTLALLAAEWHSDSSSHLSSSSQASSVTSNPSSVSSILSSVFLLPLLLPLLHLLLSSLSSFLFPHNSSVYHKKKSKKN